MPPKSKAQAVAAAIAQQVKKGKQKAIPGSPSAKMASSMKLGQIKDFVKPTKGLPAKVKQPKGY